MASFFKLFTRNTQQHLRCGIMGMAALGSPIGLFAADQMKLDDCVKFALERNFTVRISALDQDKQREKVRESAGQFDPRFELSFGNSSDDTLAYPDGDIEETDEKKQRSAAISGLLSTGTQYQIGVDYTSLDTDLIDSRYSQYNPAASIEVLQPLLKGGLHNEAKTSLSISRKQEDIEYWKFYSHVNSTVLEVVNAYADLYLASRQLEVSVNNRELAAQLLEDNRKRVALGYQAESDIILAESRSAQRQDSVFQAELNLHYQQNRLKQLISDQLDSLMHLEPVVKELPRLDEQEPDAASDFASALTRNPLFQIAGLGIGIQELRRLQQKYSLLPTLNLTVRYETFGLGASSDQGWDSLQRGDGENWFGGLQFSMSIPNRSNRARHAYSEIEKRQAEMESERIRQAILLDLDNAAFLVKSNRERFLASRHNRVLAEQSLDAESKKLKAGKSTSFFVLDQQQRLAEAQFQEIRSHVDLFKSIASYLRENGTLLDKYGIHLPQTQSQDEKSAF